MLCSISGQVPEEPVVSMKSGHMFEKRLIEKHLKAVGTCPVTKEELTVQDLMPVKSDKAVRPRPPNAASLPSMMSSFQNEWDALMLETYTLKQHLDSTRQELAHALYQHDAACRVIARLVQERDAARQALSNASTAPGAAPAAAAPETGIQGRVIEVLDAAAKSLTKGRKKRVKALAAKVNKEVDTSKFSEKSSHSLHSASKPGLLCVDVHPTQQNLVATGGVDGNAIVFDRSTGKIADTLKAHKKKVTDVKFHPDKDVVFTASADSTAIVWRKDGDKYSVGHKLAQHSGAITGVTLHPSNQYFVTASVDKTWAFWDVETGVCREQVSDKEAAAYTCVEFHPDGLILGAAGDDNIVRIFDVKQRKNVASIPHHKSAITALSFSQNGYHLATAEEGGVVKLWDLRNNLSMMHSIEQGSVVKSLSFDQSGSLLAVGGKDLRVYSSKGWDEKAKFKNHKDVVTSVAFGAGASFIASTGGAKDRQLKFFSL